MAATSLSRSTLTLPAAPLGPENPLPALLPLDEAHRIGERERAALPEEMARQVGYAPLRSVLPARILDGYGRERQPTTFETLVLENDRLRVTVLPGLGGRIASLVDRESGRELLYRNPVFQPADFALNGAWFSGGIEWNIGATGHTTLSCAPMHAAEVAAPGGDGVMLRLWEWERLRDTPFQVDLWLPDTSNFLYVGVRIRNPHQETVPVYWWSNIAVPEDDYTRVLVPADETWHFGYERSLQRVPVPEWQGADRSYPLRSGYPADYFYEVPDGERKWIAALDGQGAGLVQTSTDVLRGRKLFVWGHYRGGRRWQRWLTAPDTPGYAEIQAGLARTQLEHVPLEAGGEFAWLEAYGPLHTDAGTTHGAGEGSWAAARAHTAQRLEQALPRADVDAAYAVWRPHADREPGAPADSTADRVEWLHTGSGWGALEVARGGFTLPGTPFPADTLGPEQEPWTELLHTGVLPGPPRVLPPGPTLVSRAWRDLLEAAEAGPLDRHELNYHLGVAQWAAGDRSQAVRSWERAVARNAKWPALRCLAVADRQDGNTLRAARRYREAFGDARADAEGAWKGTAAGDPTAHDAWTPVLTALGREAVGVLLAAGQPDDAADVLDELPAAVRDRGRFHLLRAQVLLAQDEPEAARALFDDGFEVADLREGDEVLGDTWQAATGEPLPERYDFRMRE